MGIYLWSWQRCRRRLLWKDKKSEKENKTENKVEKLQEDLKVAIKEERYEDAAKIRDEIKKVERNDK